MRISPVLTATGEYPFVKLDQVKRRLAAEGVELIEIGTGVDVRVLDAGDHQRGDRQIGVRTQSGVREAGDQALLDHGNILQRVLNGC